MIVIAIISVLVSIMVPSFARARGEAAVSGCCENLTHMAAALEMYANNNEGYYPTRLKNIVPKYMAKLPVCPSGTAKYSAHYRYSYTVRPQKSYCLSCCRNNHYPYLTAEFTPSYCPLNGGLSMSVGSETIYKKYGFK